MLEEFLSRGSTMLIELIVGCVAAFFSARKFGQLMSKLLSESEEEP